MRIFVVVNRVEEIGYRQTTALLIASLFTQGLEVFVSGVDQCRFHGSADANEFLISAIQLSDANGQDETFDSRQVEAFCQRASSHAARSLKLDESDLILIRTNPGRDLPRWSFHESFLEFCMAAKSRGVRVVNAPEKLKFLASKASLSILDPRFRAPMLVSHDLKSVVEFIQDSDTDCVVKPLVGSRGKDVIKVRSTDDDLLARLADTYESRAIVAQHFIHSDEPGDKRVVVFDGKLIEVNGGLAGIHRLPAEGDFRANLHAGGTAHPLVLSDSQREAVLHAAKILMECGVRLAGIDLVGDRIIEFNVFSTGGLYDAIRFAQHDFAATVARELVAS